MAPQAQDHLVRTAIREGNTPILIQLVEILGEERDIASVIREELALMAEK